MKKFNKGYIYAGLLSDLVTYFVMLCLFFMDIIFDASANAEDVASSFYIFSAVFIIVFLCSIVYRIMYYKSSGYELTETEIKCNRGVLFRKSSVLDYKKVHAIDKKQNIFQRVFGIAVLTVDSGSTNTAHQAEIIIVEKEDTVGSLVNEINTLKENGIRSTVNTEKKEELVLSDKDSLYHFTSQRKILYTIINIAFTAFSTALTGILAAIVIGICKLMLAGDFLGTWAQYLMFAFLITVGAMLWLSFFSFVGSMVRSFVEYHKFSITRHGKDIKISYGLLEKHTNTFSYDRIMAVKISQSFVQRILGFAAIKLEVIGYTNEVGKNNVEPGMLVPFCKYSEVGEILGKVLPEYIPEKKQSKAVSYFPFISWFLLALCIIISIILLITVVLVLTSNVPAYMISAIAFSVLGAGSIALIIKLVSAFLSYKNNGIGINNGKITAYSGGFSKFITVFRNKNLIAVENVTTPLRKKKGIVSILLHLKTNALSNEVIVHIQKDTLSDELEKLLTL